MSIFLSPCAYLTFYIHHTHTLSFPSFPHVFCIVLYLCTFGGFRDDSCSILVLVCMIDPCIIPYYSTLTHFALNSCGFFFFFPTNSSSVNLSDICIIPHAKCYECECHANYQSYCEWFPTSSGFYLKYWHW